MVCLRIGVLLALASGPVESLRRMLDKDKFDMNIQLEPMASAANRRDVYTWAKDHPSQLENPSADAPGCFQYSVTDDGGKPMTYGLEIMNIKRQTDPAPEQQTADMILPAHLCKVTIKSNHALVQRAKVQKPIGSVSKVSLDTLAPVPEGTKYWWVTNDDDKSSGFFFYDVDETTDDYILTISDKPTAVAACGALGAESASVSMKIFLGLVRTCSGGAKSKVADITVPGLQAKGGKGTYQYKSKGGETDSSVRIENRRMAKNNAPVCPQPGCNGNIADKAMKDNAELPKDVTGSMCFNYEVSSGDRKTAAHFGLTVIGVTSQTPKSGHDFDLLVQLCAYSPDNSASGAWKAQLPQTRPNTPAILARKLGPVSAGTPYWYAGNLPGTFENNAGAFFFDGGRAEPSYVGAISRPGPDACAELGLTHVSEVHLALALVKSCFSGGVDSPAGASFPVEKQDITVDFLKPKNDGRGVYWFTAASIKLDAHGVPIVEEESEIPVAKILPEATSAEQFIDYLEEEMHEASNGEVQMTEEIRELAANVYNLHLAAIKAKEEYNAEINKHIADLRNLAPGKELVASFAEAAAATMDVNAQTYAFIDSLAARSGLSTEHQKALAEIKKKEAAYNAAVKTLNEAIATLHAAVNAAAPKPAAAESKGKGGKSVCKKWWFWLLLCTVLLGVVAAGVYYFFFAAAEDLAAEE